MDAGPATADWGAARIAAGALLALYVGLAAVFSFRELRFLAGVELPLRRWFIVQDVLLQVAILGVLVPCTLAPVPSKPMFIAVFAGFALLWVSALWTLITRSMYTYRLMLGIRGQRRKLEQELAAMGSGAAPSDEPKPEAGPEPRATGEGPDA